MRKVFHLIKNYMKKKTIKMKFKLFIKFVLTLFAFLFAFMLALNFYSMSSIMNYIHNYELDREMRRSSLDNIEPIDQESANEDYFKIDGQESMNLNFDFELNLNKNNDPELFKKRYINLQKDNQRLNEIQKELVQNKHKILKDTLQEILNYVQNLTLQDKQILLKKNINDSNKTEINKLASKILNEITQNHQLDKFLERSDKLSEDLKLELHFRTTSIYRIDLNCFWTSALGLIRPFEFSYSFKNRSQNVEFCRFYKYSPESIHRKTSRNPIKLQEDIVKFMFGLIKQREIRVFDEKFLKEFPVTPLINGGAWFPNFDFVKYYSTSNRHKPYKKYIFEMATYNYDCVPRERIAIVIATRNREENLNNLLIYLHYFLQKQMKAYKIFVIEQANTEASGVLFNKGRLYNVGFKQAMRDFEWDFNCIVFHDVDLLPLNYDLEYRCGDMPKHMSINIKRMSDNSLSPHYRFLTGGVLAIRPKHYELLQGFSNNFFGWGGEDDDFSLRIVEKELCVLRPTSNVSNYLMQEHKPSIENKKRWDLIMNATQRMNNDGLSNIDNLVEILSKKEYHKFTHILVDVVKEDNKN